MVIVVGSTGYYILFEGRPGILDCMYMTVISLTSVGYGEVLPVSQSRGAQIFTMILITFGMGIILYGISTLTALLIEGELSGIIKKRKMQDLIKKLKGHYIVCGGGKTGRHALAELIKNREQVVLIETDEANIAQCNESGSLLFIKGDATDDKNLMSAGIERAAGVIVCLESDKDTLFVTMSARMLNKDARIISSMNKRELAPKLKKAGANGVVSPNYIGALRMASEMIRPTVVNFLDQMIRSGRGDLRINELTISEDSPLLGKQLKDADLNNRFKLLVLGLQYPMGVMEFNPAPTLILTSKMTLIVMGRAMDLQTARKHV